MYGKLVSVRTVPVRYEVKNDVEETAVLVETLKLSDNDLDVAVLLGATLLDDDVDVVVGEVEGLIERAAAAPAITTIVTMTTATSALPTPPIILFGLT